jgi:hypothetical protein
MCRSPDESFTDFVRPTVYSEGMHEHPDLGAHQPFQRTAFEHTAFEYTVETLTEEIGRIVAERQELRAAGAPAHVLEENRRRLAAAQAELSHLLIERHLGERGAA